MSRLDSVIRRLSAQRDILNHVAQDLALPETGAFLELGLGNGRTYHHLRGLFPDRRIVVFDRALQAHKSSIPEDPADVVLGEIAETAAGFAGQGAALVHADIGTGYADVDAQTSAWLSDLVPPLLAPGGICVSGLPLTHPALRALPLPPSVPTDRYDLYVRL